ncbi:MAG: hypothetical protein EWM73_02007 [Nitrospira sp.]|nr:MAG: hypothetical protein EWM73_02007 [Nitrospira sp.]
MAKESKDALSDSWFRRLKNCPAIAGIVVFATVVIGIAQFTDAVGKLRTLFQSDQRQESFERNFRGAESVHSYDSLPASNEMAKNPTKPNSSQSSSQGIVNSPGAIQAGRDVIISPNLPQSPASTQQPRQLSKAECDALGARIKRGRMAVDRLVAERASEEARTEVLGAQKEINDWLREHLGTVHAEAFMSAEPWKQVPANYPSRYGGIYQEFRGRLTHLTSLASRYCQ